MNRAAVSAGARALAERLIALEAAAGERHAVPFATCPVCEQIRVPLTALTGIAGYIALLGRALTLAQRASPLLRSVEIGLEGSLEGLHGEALKASPVLIAHLIDLLVTFIGEDLTMRLLRDIWPELPGLKLNIPGKEEK